MANILREVTCFADESNYGELLWEGPDHPNSPSRVFLFTDGLISAGRRIQDYLKWEDATFIKCSRTLTARALGRSASGSSAATELRMRSFFTIKTPRCGLRGSSFELATPWEVADESSLHAPHSSDVITSKEGKDILGLDRRIRDRVAEAQLPQMLQRIEDGETVHFQFLSADKNGLSVSDGRSCPWGETTQASQSVIETPPPDDPYKTRYSQIVVEHDNAVFLSVRETFIPNAAALGRLCAAQQAQY